ncbi:aspartate-semialdehyde dehydrogenase [bacterium]|nr:MAG: aspartate-semialdehyde dehydrogenase [bacterium]
MKEYNLAIVGASGLVGRKMLTVLHERQLPIKELSLFASARSAGQKLIYNAQEITIQELTEDSFKGIDIALFSAGGETSKKFAPIAVAAGCTIIDNSSAWRMDSETPLVVPEVNPDALKDHKGIIANPNCSTIQLMLPLKVIHENYGLKRIICSTYQSITGAGQKGLDKLQNELGGKYSDEKPIAYNTLFHPFESNGFTNEENKMINESRKILGLPELNIAVTCVRLPIVGGHAESVNFETEKDFSIEQLRNLLILAKNIIVLDNWKEGDYPTPSEANDKDPVFVGRLRKDPSAPNSAYMWVVADNLRKGAATNAVQIAEKLIEMDLVNIK